ncbi:large ribosomal subunit protein mL48-like isoform X2 [Lineus longissimus]|uniref:large ribosomal subunit protein mL48-like isoform X2 n=1 Tax=Lineus longissimus TaxID=88925 RepID=UPI00315D2C4F
MNRVAQFLSQVVNNGSTCQCLSRKALACHRPVVTAGWRHYSRYEPDGLDDGPAIPEYDVLNIQMKSYDYVKLEAYARYVHRLTRDRFNIDTECWAVPARTTKIQTLKPNSSILQNEYNLAMYERVVQISDVPSTKMPLLLEVLNQHLPSGVNLNVKESDPDEEEFRYLPDREVGELKEQLETITKARAERRKK